MNNRVYKTDIKECEEKLGFYYLNENLIINKNSDIFDLNSNEFCIQKENAIGYKLFNNKLVHILMCETFLVKPESDHIGKVFVNHINGIKNQNQLDNLEWCTPQYNCNHAYENDLRTDNIRVLVKDLLTNEITEYRSLWACAKAMNLNGSHIWHWIQPKQYGIIKLDHYLFIKKGQDWPIVNINNANEYKNGDSKKVILIDDLNKVYLFKSMSSIKDYIDINIGTFAIMKRLRTAKEKGLAYCTIDNYKLMYLNDYKDYKLENTITLPQKRFRGNTVSPRKQYKLNVTDLNTGNIRIVESSDTLAKELNISRRTLMNRIFHKKGRINNYYIEYIR